jgi:anti-sigma regulatory factor (Ser/Thr protein kinase)
MRYEVDLARDPDSAAEARRALGEVSDHLSPRRLEDARLLVSELVTNAIRHAGLGEDDLIRLVVVTGDRALRIEVCDSGRGFEIGEPEPDPARPSGWGLYLVRELSDRWGVERELSDRWGVESAGMTRVWFELDRDRTA